MKKLLFFVFISYCVFSQDWNFLGYYDGSGRHHPITFSNDRYGYVIAGQNADGIYLSDVFRYDSQEGFWEQLLDFPGGPRGYAYGVADDTYAYMGFGSNNSGYLNDWWRYDMINDSWEQLADFPYLGRNHPAMILSENKIFIGMGSVDSENLGDWWEYDILNNNWIQKTNFSFGDRHHPFYFSINDIPYVGFGHGNYINDNIVIYNDFYKYDTNSDSWIQLNDFPSEGRVAGTQFSFNGKGYVLSGDGDDHGPLDSGELWEYDPQSDSWTQLLSHPGGARWAPGSFVINCNVFLTSGFEAESGIYHNDLLSFKLSEVCGCNDEDAFNYNNFVLINDNSCCYVAGCTDSNSLNYNDLACFNDNSCVPIILGCNNIYASNYDSLANVSSYFAGPDYINLGPGGYHYNDSWDMVFNCSQTVNLKTVDIYAETSFSTQIEILDFNDNQIYSSTIDLDIGLNQVELNFLIPEGNNYKIGINGLNDGLYRNSSISDNVFPINLLNVIEITSNTTDSPEDYFYYFYNWQLEIECDAIEGCLDEFACNYNILAIINDNSCVYPEEYYDCDGLCVNDVDDDGVCDELEILGCVDEEACNYDSEATEDENSCVYPEDYYDCEGLCINDVDNDVICDEIDNCPEDYNPDQEDFNFDNEGDACDGLELNEEFNQKQLIKIIDFLGRDNIDNNLLISIYNDGTVEKNYFLK